MEVSAATREGAWAGRLPSRPRATRRPDLTQTVPVSGLPRPCEGRPRSPAPARAAASGPWPSSGCSPVPKPERTTDPGTAPGPRGGWGTLGQRCEARQGCGGRSRGSGQARSAYWPGWCSRAETARWRPRYARGVGARATPDAPKHLTSSAIVLVAGWAVLGQRPATALRMRRRCLGPRDCSTGHAESGGPGKALRRARGRPLLRALY